MKGKNNLGSPIKDNPGPGVYDIQTSNHIPSAFFGTQNRNLDQSQNETPGPGEYDFPLSTLTGPKIKISERLTKKRYFEKKPSPGPGHYKSDNSFLLNNSGITIPKSEKMTANLKDSGIHYVISRDISAGPKFSFGVTPRVLEFKKSSSLGPGSYEIPSTIAGMPHYMIKNNKKNELEEKTIRNIIMAEIIKRAYRKANREEAKEGRNDED